MPKRRINDDNNGDDFSVPLPIQTFLWRQTNPFIRPKLGKLHESSCMEQREACKSFEKVLVQNIQFGLSPSLTEAIKSISRWRLVQAALPHVMHCCAALLYHRKERCLDKLGAAETKLLYTLHWIILDAAEECADAEMEQGIIHPPGHYLFPITAVQVFVYLFAPLAAFLKHSDFMTSFRLENGLKIWEPFWKYRHPNVACFTTHVRPKRTILKARRERRTNTKFGDVFIGGGTIQSMYNQTCYHPSVNLTDPSALTDPLSDHQLQISSSQHKVEERGHQHIRTQTTDHSPSDQQHSNNQESLPKYKEKDEEIHTSRRETAPSFESSDTSPVQTITSPASSGSGTSPSQKEEVEMEKSKSPSKDIENNVSLQGPQGNAKCKCGTTSSPETQGKIREEQKVYTSLKADAAKTDTIADISMATYLDVAVLRCLFISQWLEDGIYWAVQFIYSRLSDIAEHHSQGIRPRNRSCSLPVPKIEISFHQFPEQKRSKFMDLASEVDRVLELPFQPPSRHTSMQELHHSPSPVISEKPQQKRIKIGDFRTFVEEKLRLSERLLDKIGKDDSHGSSISEDHEVVLLRNGYPTIYEIKHAQSVVDIHPPRPRSALAMLDHKDNKLEDASAALKSEMVRGKSMPSLRFIGERHGTELLVPQFINKASLSISRKKIPAHHTHSVPNPIITVTEHSPVASVQFFLNQELGESPRENSLYPSTTVPPLCRQFTITRSQTDSNIIYNVEDTGEAPGSTHYITDEGKISFLVVLKAVHAVTLRDNTCSLRVCETVLNILDLLLSVGLLPESGDKHKSDSGLEKTGESSGTMEMEESADKFRSTFDKKSEDLSIHHLFMDSLIRVSKHMGCPHGCGEGHHSSAADMLRAQMHATLNCLHNEDKVQFRQFLQDMVIQRALTEVVDFFHAFVGFCSEPGTLISPLSQKRTSAGGTQELINRNSYSTNFGAGFRGSGTKGTEGFVITYTFKCLITRLVQTMKDLKNQENMALYCDIRQLVSYIRDNHGGVFRRTALSGLLDSAERPHKKDKNSMPTTRIVRHTKSFDHEEYRDPIYSPTVFVVDETAMEKTSRKSFFRRKGVRKAPSTQSIADDREDASTCPSPAPGQTTPTTFHQHRAVTPRLSVSDEENISLQMTPKLHKTNRFQIVNWLKGDRLKQDTKALEFEDGNISPLPVDTYPLPEKLSRATSFINRTPKLSHKSSSHVSLTFLRARKRMEDHLTKIGFGRNKNKHGSFEEPLDLSRRNSCDMDHGLKDGEFIVVKESKLVNIKAVFAGMQRFAFLLETCQPGTIPDPPLLAAALDLKAPVVARAALFLQCAHFVHRCNKGHWPSWMKLNLPVFRPSGPLANRGTPSGLRRTHILQRAAGRMFYQWAEAIGSRLEEMIHLDLPDVADVVTGATDESKKRQLKLEDEEEDFLDEASVNTAGSNCPYALKMAACQLLLEITAFLRETYQYLPHKSSRLSARERHNFEPRSITANRRWSMALSSLGFSQNSAHSLVSLAEQVHPIPPGERRISFVLHEATDLEGESENSSNTTLTVQEEEDKRSRRIAQGRPHLLRRTPGSGIGHNSSFKRRSLKLKKPTDRKTRPRSSTFIEDDENGGLRRADSICSKRKASAVSDRSDTSERADISGEESPGVLSDDQPPESPVDILESDDDSLTKHMPWLKVVLQVSSTLNFICPHQHFCHPNCYRRQMRACNRLIKTIQKVFGENIASEQDAEKQQEYKDDIKKEKKLKKIITAPSSPLKRKASIAHNLDKLEKAMDVPHMGALRSLHSSTTFLAHDPEVPAVVDKDIKPSVVVIKKKPETPKEESAFLKYVKTQIKGLFHSPISTLIKGAVVMPDDLFTDTICIAWELLLESDQHLVAAAAVIFILSSVKAPGQASMMLSKELQHDDPMERINAVLKFQSLWKYRYHCWPEMEDGAHITFKVPPPAIEFTLPSPKIAVDGVPVADTPWMPHVKAKVEEVTINQDQSLQRSFVTATKTRRKQQMELIHKALQEEEEKKRTERENYRITTVAVTNQAAYEPALFHAVEEHEEGDDDQPLERNPAHHLQVAQALFPSCLSSAAVIIINLLEDAQVGPDGIAVYEVAFKVIWMCLVEDCGLFLRHVLEKLTREKQEVMFQVLRRLLRFVPQLPPQAAYSLYNYLVGFIMFYVRTPVENGHEFIGNALSILWQVVPSVHGLFLKDLKQVLRKEQCDATLLITANVPSAKKIIINGPDAGGIPSQFPIHEDTQFSHILQDSLDFFGIDESQHHSYFLVDTKTNQMHNLDAFVRDFYFFKRSQYPQLSLIHMNPEDAFATLQRQAFTLRFVELGKVLMSLSILKSTTQVAQRVFFIHEELMKLPSFPRKALEADFSLYTGPLGKEMLGMDTLHKMVWLKLVARMFDAMAGLFVHSSDIHLFLNVINGILVLHAEDASMLRLCMATYINAAHQFKNIFSSNGYLLIMPTILCIFSNHQTNGLLCRTIEFVCKQFYIMHRKPFILQMFGSVAPILDVDTSSSYGDASKVQPKAFFQLMQSLEQYVVDPLDILELVDAEKPLRALDFCYQMDPDTLSVLDAVSLCVTVVSYAADSQRGHQMLTVLEAILPFYLKHLQTLTAKKETPGGSRTELHMIHNISICMKTLINNCEALARNYTGPQRAIDLRGSSIKNTSRGACSPPFEVDDDSHSKFMSESYYSSRKQQQQYDREVEDSEILRTEFRRPRDTLLVVVSEFLTKCSARLSDLSKKIPDLSSKATELLDVKCHLRLAEVAHSLLKVSPYDPVTMACSGLQHYMNEVLPHSEWAQESMRPALIMVLRRLDKTFTKIAKKPAIRRLVDWNAAKSLLKGVYLTLYRHPYIAHLPHLKSLIAVCQSIVLGDQSASANAESVTNLPSSAAAVGQSPPPAFCSVVVRLVAMQMMALGECQSLESVCGGSATFSSPDKVEIYLMNLILPMCIRISSGTNDVPKLRQSDISFALTMVLHALTPASYKRFQQATVAKGGTDSNIVQDKSPSHSRGSLFQIGFIGLKILIVCFERHLGGDWHRIACCIRELGNRFQGGIALWSFLDFVVTHRTPLYIMLYPLIKYKMLHTICDNEQEYYFQQLIREKLQGFSLPPPKSMGSLFSDLVVELRSLKEDLIAWKIGGGEMDYLKSVVSDVHNSDVSRTAAYLYGRSSTAMTHRASCVEIGTDEQGLAKLGNSSGTFGSRRSPLTRELSTRSETYFPTRGLSIRFHTREGSKRAMQHLLRRTSYPYPDEGSTSSQGRSPCVYSTSEILDAESSSSEPRLYRKTTLHVKKRGSKKSAGGSGSLTSVGVADGERNDEDVDIQDGEQGTTSQPPSCPTSPGGVHSPDHDSEMQRPRHRLQRQKAQSRKTFRFRKSRRGAGWTAHAEATDGAEEIAMVATKQPTLAEEEASASIVDTTPQEPEFPVKQKSENREECPVEYHAPRRRGAVHIHSQSRSPSPEKASTSDTYIMQCESTESLSNNEKSALLKREDKQTPEAFQSSLMIVFPSKDENTCV